jgi:hypothetical protein
MDLDDSDITPGMAWKDIPREWQLWFIDALRTPLVVVGDDPLDIISDAAANVLEDA